MEKQPPETFRAFLTGSHAYGLPNEDSDVDLVVFLSETDYGKVVNLAEKSGHELDEDYRKQGCMPLQFGKLQLLCCFNEEAYRVWKEGTWLLKKQKPVSRAFAIKRFKGLREEAGL